MPNLKKNVKQQGQKPQLTYPLTWVSEGVAQVADDVDHTHIKCQEILRK